MPRSPQARASPSGTRQRSSAPSDAHRRLTPVENQCQAPFGRFPIAAHPRLRIPMESSRGRREDLPHPTHGNSQFLRELQIQASRPRVQESGRFARAGPGPIHERFSGPSVKLQTHHSAPAQPFQADGPRAGDELKPSEIPRVTRHEPDGQGTGPGMDVYPRHRKRGQVEEGLCLSQGQSQIQRNARSQVQGEPVGLPRNPDTPTIPLRQALRSNEERGLLDILGFLPGRTEDASRFEVIATIAQLQIEEILGSAARNLQLSRRQIDGSPEGLPTAPWLSIPDHPDPVSQIARRNEKSGDEYRTGASSQCPATS